MKKLKRICNYFIIWRKKKKIGMAKPWKHIAHFMRFWFFNKKKKNTKKQNVHFVNGANFPNQHHPQSNYNSINVRWTWNIWCGLIKATIESTMNYNLVYFIFVIWLVCLFYFVIDVINERPIENGWFSSIWLQHTHKQFINRTIFGWLKINDKKLLVVRRPLLFRLSQRWIIFRFIILTHSV